MDSVANIPVVCGCYGAGCSFGEVIFLFDTLFIGNTGGMMVSTALNKQYPLVF